MDYVIYNGRLVPVPAGGQDDPPRTQTINGEVIELTSQEEVRDAQLAAVVTGTMPYGDGTMTVTPNDDGTFRVEFDLGRNKGIVERMDVGEILHRQGQAPEGPGVHKGRSIQDIKDETVFAEDLADLPQPGGGQQTAALLESKPKFAEAIERQRGELQSRFERFRQGEGVNLAALIESGEFTDEEISRLFSAREVDEARTLLRERADYGDFLEAREEAQQDLLEAREQERAALTDRIEAAGGLVPALYSDDPEERITRQQAIDLGYTGEQIDQAIAEERAYVEALGQYDAGIRDAAAERREATREPIDGLPAEATTGAPVSSGRDPAVQSIIDRLAPFAAAEGRYDVGIAVATGAISEAEARQVFGDNADEAVRQASALRTAANEGYYADWRLVPDSLRQVLLVRSAELSRRLEEERGKGRAATGVLIANLERDIATIDSILDPDRFPSRGVLLPDVEVRTISRDIAGMEQQREARSRELTAAESLYGAGDESAQFIRGQISILDADLASRRQSLERAVERAERDPITGLRSDPPLETLEQFARASPDEVARIAIREAAIFAASTVATSLVLSAVGGVAARVLSSRAQQSLAVAAEEYRLLQQNARLLQLLRMERDNAARVGRLVPASISPEEEAALVRSLRSSLDDAIVRQIEQTGDVPIEAIVARLSPAERAQFAGLGGEAVARVVSSALQPTPTSDVIPTTAAQARDGVNPVLARVQEEEAQQFRDELARALNAFRQRNSGRSPTPGESAALAASVAERLGLAARYGPGVAQQLTSGVVIDRTPSVSAADLNRPERPTDPELVRRDQAEEIAALLQRATDPVTRRTLIEMQQETEIDQLSGSRAAELAQLARPASAVATMPDVGLPSLDPVPDPEGVPDLTLPDPIEEPGTGAEISPSGGLEIGPEDSTTGEDLPADAPSDAAEPDLGLVIEPTDTTMFDPSVISDEAPASGVQPSTPPAQRPGMLPAMLPAFQTGPASSTDFSIEIDPDPFPDPDAITDPDAQPDPFPDPFSNPEPSPALFEDPFPYRDDAPSRPRGPRSPKPKARSGVPSKPPQPSAAKLADPHHRFRYRKQGLFYVRFDTQTGSSVFSRVPFVARQNTPKGKGSAKSSYRKGGPTSQRPRHLTERMGKFNVQHNGRLSYVPRATRSGKSNPRKGKR